MDHLPQQDKDRTLQRGQVHNVDLKDFDLLINGTQISQIGSSQVTDITTLWLNDVLQSCLQNGNFTEENSFTPFDSTVLSQQSVARKLQATNNVETYTANFTGFARFTALAGLVPVPDEAVLNCQALSFEDSNALRQSMQASNATGLGGAVQSALVRESILETTAPTGPPTGAPTVDNSTTSPTLSPTLQSDVITEISVSDNDNRIITNTCRPSLPANAQSLTEQLIQYSYIVNVQEGTILPIVLTQIEESISTSLTQTFLDCQFDNDNVRNFYVYKLSSAPNDRAGGGCLSDEQVDGATCYSVDGQLSVNYFYLDQTDTTTGTTTRYLQQQETEIADERVAQAFADALEEIFSQEDIGGSNVVGKSFTGITNEVPSAGISTFHALHCFMLLLLGWYLSR